VKDRYARAFIALDEWVGMLLLVYLHRVDSPLFWVVLPLWVVAVYVISYPLYWLDSARKYDVTTPLVPILAAVRAVKRRCLRDERDKVVTVDLKSTAARVREMLESRYPPRADVEAILAKLEKPPRGDNKTRRIYVQDAVLAVFPKADTSTDLDTEVYVRVPDGEVVFDVMAWRVKPSG
jgi:hypothetical protein